MGIPQQFTNFASSILAASITPTSLSLTVNTGDGALFPALSAGQYFVAVIVSASNPDLREIVKVTARAGDTMTIVRGQEGTTPQSWGASDIFELRLTAGGIAVIAGAVQSVANIAALRLLSGNIDGQPAILNGYYAEGDGGGGQFFWNATSTVADNGGTIIAPTGVGTGRWYRAYNGGIYAEWFGAKGDGTTDDSTSINSAIASLKPYDGNPGGGTVIFSSVKNYAIGTTISLLYATVKLTSATGGSGGSTTSCALITALSALSGPMIEINIDSGDKGGWIENLTFDGLSQAGVTAGIQYADGTISTADLNYVTIRNVPTGILTGSNQQSYEWNRVIASVGIATGVSIGANSRHIVANFCVFGGTTTAASIGSNDTTTGNTSTLITFNECEFYAQTGTSGTSAASIFNTFGVVFNSCWFENNGSSISNLVIVGGGVAVPSYTTFANCFFQGNSLTATAIDVISATGIYIIKPTYSSFTGTVFAVASGVTNPQVQSSTPTIVSGTGYQNTSPFWITLYVRVVFTPTSGAAASCQVSMGPTTGPIPTLFTDSVPAGTALDSFIRSLVIRVPPTWYYAFTVTNATIGPCAKILEYNT
jgi:hypothetical protein